ncbi:undecaprenyl-diphosphate phosphatase [Caballeronia sp. LP006]|uniref:undecaprenyl-diphosphate phosphatase n=1 Tax=unclassified Caballeronia TaxID=2646786 RepID=UPI001FD33AC4|nr:MULTISPECIES: undecaprenyl-diphosphate phosphatase [unclassified Caballeronia]MDR5804460.1 undecaprenyl-diphosphate phosphatase [Caballeronia sp. LZ001]MDR5831703.1 undecaprenyl-diphosphate phosphatase [Caballeronia sp. LP006]
MTLWFLIFLSVLQGVTELFPVSSLGHTLLVPGLIGMHIDKHAPQLLPFLVALHLGTALALLWYFRKRWVALIGGWFASLGGRRNDDGHMMWALIIGTIPTGIVGLLLEKRLEALFHDLRIVAAALIVNGVLLWFGDKLQRARAARAPEKLTFKQAFLVGLAQIGALIPGFSRSGLTIIAGVGAGLTAEAAAEFSFLLGTPIIFAAGVLELPKLFHAPGQLFDALLGGVLTGIAAYLSVRFLMRYFEGHGKLASFGVYCVIAGIFFFGWFMMHPQPL